MPVILIWCHYHCKVLFVILWGSNFTIIKEANFIFLIIQGTKFFSTNKHKQNWNTVAIDLQSALATSRYSFVQNTYQIRFTQEASKLHMSPYEHLLAKMVKNMSSGKAWGNTPSLRPNGSWFPPVEHKLNTSFRSRSNIWTVYIGWIQTATFCTTCPYNSTILIFAGLLVILSVLSSCDGMSMNNTAKM